MGDVQEADSSSTTASSQPPTPAALTGLRPGSTPAPRLISPPPQPVEGDVTLSAEQKVQMRLELEKQQGNGGFAAALNRLLEDLKREVLSEYLRSRPFSAEGSEVHFENSSRPLSAEGTEATLVEVPPARAPNRKMSGSERQLSGHNYISNALVHPPKIPEEGMSRQSSSEDESRAPTLYSFVRSIDHTEDKHSEQALHDRQLNHMRSMSSTTRKANRSVRSYTTGGLAVAAAAAAAASRGSTGTRVATDPFASGERRTNTADTTAQIVTTPMAERQPCPRRRTSALCRGSRKGSDGDVLENQSQVSGRARLPMTGTSTSGSASPPVAGRRESTDCRHYEVHPIWSARVPRHVSKLRVGILSKLATHSSNISIYDLNAASTGRGVSPWWRRILIDVLPPNCQMRMIWDVMAMAALCYDLFSIPLNLIELPLIDGLDVMRWATRIYWSADVFIAFRSGYYLPNGDQVNDHPKIAKRYARTWLVPDVALVILEYTSEVMTRSASTFGKLTRSTRILRLLRLVRVIRAPKMIRRMIEHIRSEKLILFVSIAKSMTCILSLIHLLACAWYGLGTFDGGWVGRKDVLEQSPELRYATTFLWSLSQFTGSTDLFPETLIERTFAIVAQTFAFIAVTVFVSDLTSSMTRLHIISGRQSTQLSVLRKYMMDRGISVRLMHRITMNASYMLAERRKTMPEHEVDLLMLVSQPLKEELRFECFAPTLVTHPLFQVLFDDNPVVARKICAMAVSVVNFCEGDMLFSPGETPFTNQMFFVLRGKLSYNMPKVKNADLERDQGDDLVSELSYDEDAELDEDCQISAGEWVGEATLWCQWVYKGWLHAIEPVQLLIIGGEAFQKIVSTSHLNTVDPWKYAQAFVNRLNEEPETINELGSSINSELLVESAVRRRRIRRAVMKKILSDHSTDSITKRRKDGNKRPKVWDENEVAFRRVSTTDWTKASDGMSKTYSTGSGVNRSVSHGSRRGSDVSALSSLSGVGGASNAAAGAGGVRAAATQPKEFTSIGP